MRYLLILTLLLFSTSLANNKIPITITRVIDGDTLNVKMQSGNKFTMRLVGIDCFEAYKNHRTKQQAKEYNLTTKQVLNKGKESKEYLNKLKDNAETTSFIFKGLDKYNRILGILYFDELNINQKLINEGYCKIYQFREQL